MDKFILIQRSLFYIEESILQKQSFYLLFYAGIFCIPTGGGHEIVYIPDQKSDHVILTLHH